MDDSFVKQLGAEQVLAVVRAGSVPNGADLCAALAQGGIRNIEFTFTTPDVLEHIRTAVEAQYSHGAIVGVGSVLTANQAKAAIDAGAQFLVTPGIRPEVARVAQQAGMPFSLGALTPSEVAQAMDLGSTVIKIFPAKQFGPSYLEDLRGPYPDVKLLPSGGISAANAGDYLRSGAYAVCCGTSVVSPDAVAAGNYSDITTRAKEFCGSIEGQPL